MDTQGVDRCLKPYSSSTLYTYIYNYISLWTVGAYVREFPEKLTDVKLFLGKLAICKCLWFNGGELVN